jgi:DNA-binding PucR family transcriptional regulator
MASVTGGRTPRTSDGLSVDDAITLMVLEVLALPGDHGLQMAELLLTEIPELRAAAGADGETLLEETRASCQSNLDCALANMRPGTLPDEPPVAAVEWARNMVHRGLQLSTILRAYRLGHGQFWQTWHGLLVERIPDQDLRSRVLERTSAFMFAYVDAVCARLVEEYAAERERWVRSAAAVRSEMARRLLAGEAVESDAASHVLNYELRRHHVALVLWIPAQDGEAGAPLEPLATRVAQHLGSADPLVVPAGRSLLWAWCGAHEPLDPGRLESLRGLGRDAEVRIAVGESAHGPAGFVRSHEEAQQARRMAGLSARRAGCIVRYRQVALAGLLSADLGMARRFVEAELGPLAGDEDASARLRATVAAFLDHGLSHVRTGRQLGIHQNTVAYRVRRAEELLGHPVQERRQELEAALLLARALPAGETPR